MLSDIERSTQLWSAAPSSMSAALRVHDRIAREAVERAGGRLVKHTGDGFLARFDAVGEAIDAALSVQRVLGSSQETGVELRVRMAVHAGEAEQRDDDWFGTAINRTARMLELGNGGQILVSGVIAGLVEDAPVGGCTLVDLGVHALRDLTAPEHIYQVLAPGVLARVPALRNDDGLAARRLPRRRSSFVGRHDELVKSERVLPDHRLVTLVGAGGIGKTRLDEQIAAVDSDSGGRVWWVDLTRAERADGIDGLLISATGARTSPQAADLASVVAGSLSRAGPGLLVIDNCEHVMPAIAELIDRLLDAVPSLRVLATSRQALGIDDEYVWRLGPLTVPAADTHAAQTSEALALFVARAGLVQPDLASDESIRGPIEEVCRRLDGVPLALELAAARLRHVTVGELLSSLEGTFPLLLDDQRSHPARHRTVSDSLRWSHDELSSDAQELLWSLAILVGPFSAQTAGELTGLGGAELVDRLGALVDASLIEFDVTTGEHRLLETVRQFAIATATERGVIDGLRDRHLARCRRLAEKWAADEIIVSFDIVDDIIRERSNLVAGLEWSCTRERSPAVELAAPLATAAVAQRLVADTSSWSTLLLLALEGSDRVTWSRAVAACARLRTELGDVVFLERTIPEAVEIARASGDVATEAACEMMLGAAAFVAGHPGWSAQLAAAADLAVQAERLPLELEIRSWLAWSLAWNGQAVDAEVQLLRCAELGVADSIHGGQCAVARDVTATWRGLPVDPAVVGPTETLLDDPFLGFAAALRALYTGEAGVLDVAWDGEAEGLMAAMRLVIGALRTLLVDGDPERAAQQIETQAAEPWLGRPVFPIVWPGATIHLAADRVEVARQLAEVAASVAAPDGWGEVAVAMLRSELALHDGELVAAERGALQALRTAVRQSLRPWMCDAVEQIAFIDVAAGRLDRASALGRASTDERATTGFRYRLPHRQHRWDEGIVPLVGSNAWSDATADLDTVAEWLLRRGSRRSPASRSGWDALTSTEVVVIDHVREGHTNAQIGALMYVSPSTVKSHLEHIYAKLGARGRVELLGVAARHRDREGS